MLVVYSINLISIQLEIKSFKTISGDEVTLRRQDGVSVSATL